MSNNVNAGHSETMAKKVATPQISETLQWYSLNQTVWRMAQETTWRDQATSRIPVTGSPGRAQHVEHAQWMRGTGGALRGITGHYGAHFLRFGSRWAEDSLRQHGICWNMLNWLQVPKKKNAPQIVIKSEGKLLIGSSSWGWSTGTFPLLNLHDNVHCNLHYNLHYNLHSVTTYITLPCIALHSSPLHSITLHSITLQLTLHYIATFIALHCNFHCITSRYITLHFTFPYLTLPYISLHYSTLYYIHVYGYMN